jgi:hypothetical protein
MWRDGRARHACTMSISRRSMDAAVPRPDSARVLGAGAASFAAVFAAGFVLGTVRVLIVEPRVGSVVATLLELPVMLAVSWVVWGATIRRWAIPAERGSRATMGAIAFALLIAAELVLGRYGFGRSFGEQLAALSQPAGLIGLAAQIAFGCMPLMRR